MADADAAGLRGLRFHDLRHSAITELAERDASEMTVMAIAGHVSRKMWEHYSHIRMEAKRRALEALATGPETGLSGRLRHNWQHNYRFRARRRPVSC